MVKWNCAFVPYRPCLDRKSGSFFGVFSKVRWSYWVQLRAILCEKISDFRRYLAIWNTNPLWNCKIYGVELAMGRFLSNLEALIMVSLFGLVLAFYALRQFLVRNSPFRGLGSSNRRKTLINSDAS